MGRVPITLKLGPYVMVSIGAITNLFMCHQYGPIWSVGAFMARVGSTEANSAPAFL